MADAKKIINIESDASRIKYKDTTVEKYLDEEVSTRDHKHSASEIETDNDHQFVTQEEKDKIAGDLAVTYSNDEPTVVALGGIPAGSTFKDMTIQQMFDKLLYPYKSPSLSVSITNTPSGTLFEKGTQVTVQTVTAKVTKGSNKITKVEFIKDGYILETHSLTGDDQNGGTYTANLTTMNKLNSGSHYYRARVTDNSGNAMISADSPTIQFVAPFFYGSIDKNVGIPSAEQVLALTKHLVTRGNKTINFTCNDQKMVFAYPASYGNLSKIYDANNFDVTDTFEKYTVSITSELDSTEDYYVYINSASTVQNFTMKFNF